MEEPFVYMPMDRRHAIAKACTLPNRTYGAALFADISGFTSLTESLVRELGTQRGMQELRNYLDRFYNTVIDKLHRYRGSVISFAGDAMTCWLDGDNGLRATNCALAMQQEMQEAVTTYTPSLSSLSMKVVVAVGPVRRFVVGDPNICMLDVLAGKTLDRLAMAGYQAKKGQVVVDIHTLENLAHLLQIEKIGLDPNTGTTFGVIRDIVERFTEAPWPELTLKTMDCLESQRWISPMAYERIVSMRDVFSGDLRPAVALFLRFGGIDYDGDEEAEDKLNAYIRWVQGVVADYDGTLIDLNIGDKGSYIYISFDSTRPYENRAFCAALVALALREPPSEFSYMDPVQIGISQGWMCAGIYGNTNRRTYGVLGNEVNVASHLMTKAKSNQILVSRSGYNPIADSFTFETVSHIHLKGKSKPITAFALTGRKSPDSKLLW